MTTNLLNERNQLFAFAKVQFSDSNDFHFRILQTIYEKLTGVAICPRYGPHWELIGF